MFKEKLIKQLKNLDIDAILEAAQNKEDNRTTMLLYYRDNNEVAFDEGNRTAESYEDTMYLLNNDKVYLSDIIKFEFIDMYHYFSDKEFSFNQKIDIKEIVDDVFNKFDTYRCSDTYKFEKDVFATRTIVSECIRQMFDKMH